MSALFEFTAAMLSVVVLAGLVLDALWLLAVAVLLLTALFGARAVWRHGVGRLRAACDGAGECCQACAVMAADDEDGSEDGPLTDEVMDPIRGIFSDEIRPVNRPHPPSVWSRLDMPESNRGRRFDEPSRQRNERLGRWLTAEQQAAAARAAAPQVIAEAEAILRFGQSIRDRGETTGEIRRGDPGE